MGSQSFLIGPPCKKKCLYLSKHFQSTLEVFGTICVYKNLILKRLLWVLEEKEKFATPTLQTTIRICTRFRRSNVEDILIGQALVSIQRQPLTSYCTHCPPKRSQKSLRQRLVPVPLTVCSVT